MSEREGNPTKQGRSRVFHVGRQQMLDLMESAQADLPLDAYVSSVSYDWERSSFCVQVDSMEFEPVMPGDLIPVIQVKVHVPRRQQ